MKVTRRCLINIHVLFLFLSAAYAQDLEKIKVYYQPSMPLAPIIIAYEEGYFKEQGLDVELVNSRNIAEALIPLLQGRLDVIAGPPTAGMYNAVKEGKKLKFVAPVVFYEKNNRFSGIISKKSLSGEIKNKRVGITLRSSLQHFFLETTFQKRGISIDEKDLIIMDFPVIMESLNKNDLDAAFLIEPFISKLNFDSLTSFISLGDEFPDTAVSFLIYGNNFLNNPGLGVRFMLAYLRGCSQYNMGKTQRNIEIMKKHIKLDEGLLMKMSWPVVKPGFTNTAVLDDYQNWLFAKDYIADKIDIKSMIDRSFIDKAGIQISNADSPNK